MGQYGAMKLYKDETQSKSLMEETRREQDRDSSDGESTIIENLEWKESPSLKKGVSRRGLVTTLFICLTILFTAIVSLLAWLIILQRFHHSDVESNGHGQGTNQFQIDAGISSCGNSSTSALAAGCHFDIFSFGWTPRECTDLQLYNESISKLRNQTRGAFVFYTPNHDPIPLSAFEDYGTGENVPAAGVTDDHEILATWEHYLVGCTYAWQKVQRAAMREWPLEEWSTSYAMAKRCGPDLLWRQKIISESVEARVKPWYPTCGLGAAHIREEIEKALQV